jgi:hypothetical protein
MLKQYINFIRSVSINTVGKTGVILTTATFVTFIIFEFFHTIGVFKNAYIGLVTYLAFPALFILGLILIPIGWYRYKKESGKSTQELLNRQFDTGQILPRLWGSRVMRTVFLLTLVNIAILGFASMRMLHFMDQSRFCGTACHQVMNPEWVTYQRSPHARVACVECHVGEGLDALVASKLNGLRQMYLAALNLYNRPIPTPVHQLRPARETCEKCHWPEKFLGQRLITHVDYDDDSLSTPSYNTLNVKIDAGTGGKTPGAHWHIAESNRISYTSLKDERRVITTVWQRRSDGYAIIYHDNRYPSQSKEEQRVMDCIDCHNRATHIYKTPQDAVDERIRGGTLDRTLPFIKKVSLDAIMHQYPDSASARTGIANHMNAFYQRDYPDVFLKKRKQIDSAIRTLQDIYAINIHPYMNITWGAYPSHLAHHQDLGCFRCHHHNMVNKDDEAIAHDCTLCHSILALDSDSPYAFLMQSDSSKTGAMQRFLKSEFFRTHF